VAKGDNMQERLVSLAMQLIRMSAAFPKGAAGKHIQPAQYPGKDKPRKNKPRNGQAIPRA
jgi:hypothetical protein